MQIIIPFHSFIDVITNSSTEIFVNTHSKTIEYAKNLVNSLLEAAKSDKTADDLFEFKTQKKLFWSSENEDEPDDDEKWIDEGGIYDENKWDDTDCEGVGQGRLIITAKNKSKVTIDLAEELTKIFELESSYR